MTTLTKDEVHDAMVVMIVRVGISKHTAREFAGHFYTLCRVDLVADAERYRWFADVAVTGAFDKAEAAFACLGDAEACTKDELDAALDEAMTETKQVLENIEPLKETK